MPGYLQLAQAARVAHARIRSAQELEARWKALAPDEQEQSREEWRAMRSSLGAVRDRLTAAPKGFVRGFGAGYRGEEPEPVEEGRPLKDIARDLHAATEALRRRLDGLRDEDDGPVAGDDERPPAPRMRDAPRER